MSRRFIYDPMYSIHPASSATVNEMLGLRPKQKLPKEGMPMRMLQGFQVWVAPLQDRLTSRIVGKRSTHRVLAICPGCGQTLSVGRLQQHVCKAEGKANPA